MRPRMVFRVKAVNTFYDWDRHAFPVYATCGRVMILIGWERL